MLMGYAVLSTRIEIARDGLLIAAPGWRACPWPPVRQLRLDWADVRAVRHRTELYRIGPLPVRFPLEAYAIETAGSFILLGGYYLSDLEPILIELAHRADRPLVRKRRDRGRPAAYALSRCATLAKGRSAASLIGVGSRQIVGPRCQRSRSRKASVGAIEPRGSRRRRRAGWRWCDWRCGARAGCAEAGGRGQRARCSRGRSRRGSGAW